MAAPKPPRPALTSPGRVCSLLLFFLALAPHTALASQHAHSPRVRVAARALNDTHAQLLVFNSKASVVGLVQSVVEDENARDSVNFGLLQALRQLSLHAQLELWGTVLQLEPAGAHDASAAATTMTAPLATTPAAGPATAAPGTDGPAANGSAQGQPTLAASTSTAAPAAQDAELELSGTATVPYCMREVKGCITPSTLYSVYFSMDGIVFGASCVFDGAEDTTGSPDAGSDNSTHTCEGMQPVAPPTFVAPQPDIGLQLLTVEEVTSSTAR